MNDFENAFLRVPKALFFCGTYADLSAGAKLLYALLDDRNRLSKKNGWEDVTGHTYLYYTNNEIARMLGICEKSAGTLLRELENVGLIERERRGAGKPWTIYVRPPVWETLEDYLRKHAAGENRSGIPARKHNM